MIRNASISSVDFDNYGNGQYGRLGCCPSGSYMSNPFLNPFDETSSCSMCPAGKYNTQANDETSCLDCPSNTYSVSGASSCLYSTNTCPAGTTASGPASCVAPLCNVADGSSANANACRCGVKDCTTSTGLFCKLNYCSKVAIGLKTTPDQTDCNSLWCALVMLLY